MQGLWQKRIQATKKIWNMLRWYGDVRKLEEDTATIKCVKNSKTTRVVGGKGEAEHSRQSGKEKKKGKEKSNG